MQSRGGWQIIYNNYDEFARWYDLILGDWNTTVKHYENLLSEHLELGKVELGIDVGCGTGVYLVALARLLPKAIGVDISASMLDKARVNMATELTQWELIQTSWYNLPLMNNSDVIIVCAGNSISSCIKDSSLFRVLSEFRRVVGRGQIYVDARNVKYVHNYGVSRTRGRGIIDGAEYAVYDTISLCDDNSYEVKMVIREGQENGNQRIVSETRLMYRQNTRDAVIRMAPDIGLSVESCFITHDLGEAFDSIIMSAVR